MRVTSDLFPSFFAEVNDKHRAFPWQARLARQVCEKGWPRCINLPTAGGKTALLDIAVFALAAGAPEAARRIFYVVNRRVVVDEAAERAYRLAKTLRNARENSIAGQVAAKLRELAGGEQEDPLFVATLRGGMPRDDWWARSPVQPTICCSTVDQVGSSLLFRAYGSRSNRNWPIRAGLAANDSLIILDEAHTSTAFAQTLDHITRYRQGSPEAGHRPMTVVEMSATPGNLGECFRQDESDEEHPVLKLRWEAPKPTRLVIAETKSDAPDEFEAVVNGLTAQARNARHAGAKVIGVIVNRVATARSVFGNLVREPGCQSVLLTGRARAFDRDRIWRDWRERIELDRQQEPVEPVFVVATQCIEVGANIDFDALVTEIAALDALEQRFGRLNRGGSHRVHYAAIVAQKEQTKEKYVDAVYGGALSATWRFLEQNTRTVERPEVVAAGAGKKPKTRKVKDRILDMGVLALRTMKPEGEALAALSPPRTGAPVLLPAHLDRLAQTEPVPAIEPEVSFFLHGPNAGPADVQIVWRADLNGTERSEWADRVAAVPPKAPEMLAVPVWAFRRWLAGAAPTTTELSDIEGSAQQDAKPPTATKQVLLWRGQEDSEVVLSARVRPGDTAVLPASYGGCDDWGWNPASETAVRDIADEVSLRVYARAVLRLHPDVVDEWTAGSNGQPEFRDFAKHLSENEEREAIQEKLQALADNEGAKQWVRNAANELRTGRIWLVYSDSGNTITAIQRRRTEIKQEEITASLTVEVPLEEHMERCRNRVERFARLLGFGEPVVRTMSRAMRYHDIGKADRRFQAWLAGGMPPSKLLAKSKRNGRDRAAGQRARELAGYPKGGRHELQSVALLTRAPDFAGFPGEDIDRELLLHLIASHHGFCRPFAPVVDDTEPVTVRYGEWHASSRHALESAGSGVSQRFWRLNRRYGWYGLAYLETVFRLADQLESEYEQETGEALGATTSN